MSNEVDLRSDTVTRPTPGMRKAIAEAEVGDDVWGDDPTINSLQARCAELTGKEAALYVVSGTMGNLLGILSQTSRGDEIVMGHQAHMLLYEAGSVASVGAIQVRTIHADRGRLDPADIVAMKHPDDPHFAELRVLCLENTHNVSGGSVVPFESLERAARSAREIGLAVHLDGARLWNASVATGIPIAKYAALADTVSLCFSKGLGAPVGSILAGTREVIHRAERARKRVGGGIRQGGVLAAACHYALDHHVDRLAEDHARARAFADAVAEIPAVEVEVDRVESNMVLVHLRGESDSAGAATERLARAGVLISEIGPRTLRAVFHLDVDDDGLGRAVEGMHRAFDDHYASVRGR